MNQTYIIAFWSPFSLRDLHFCTDFFSPLLKKYGDIQCLDCGCRNDARTQRLLSQADLVVIGLPQKKSLLDEYFCYEFRHFRKMMYVIVDYFSKGSICPEAICRRYRIPSNRLARIPYNIRFLEAERRGQSRQYFELQDYPLPYEGYIDFQAELTRSAKLFLQALETV